MHTYVRHTGIHVNTERNVTDSQTERQTDRQRQTDRAMDGWWMDGMTSRELES